METDQFVSRLRETLAVPVETFDERFTTDLAEQTGDKPPCHRRRRRSSSPVQLPDMVEQRVPLRGSPSRHRQPPSRGRIVLRRVIALGVLVAVLASPPGASCPRVGSDRRHRREDGEARGSRSATGP